MAAKTGVRVDAQNPGVDLSPPPGLLRRRVSHRFSPAAALTTRDLTPMRMR